MTIQEAIRSGKRFRRPNSLCGYFSASQGYVDEEGDTGYTLTTEDIVATDWEVEPTPVTREQILAVETKLKDIGYRCSACQQVPLESILREVGL